MATLVAGGDADRVDAHYHVATVHFVQRFLALEGATMTNNTVCFGNASTFEYLTGDVVLAGRPMVFTFHVDAREARHAVPVSCVDVCNVLVDRLGLAFLDQPTKAAPFASASSPPARPGGARCTPAR